jgi:exopolysaccharide biosynthesis protein
MKTFLFSLLISAAAVANAQWQSIGPGVDYQEFKRENQDIYVTRIDLTNDKIAVIASRESEKGTRVSDFGRKNKALAAINGDYFDDRFNPVGTTVGPCGAWDNVLHTKREGLITVGDENATITKQSDVDPDAPPPDGAATAVSGWPALIVNCQPLAAQKLPGSDSFTRSPHPRTAVGLSRDGKTMYFVVADGRRAGVPGLTLSQLASFMSDELDACSAMNLDGGGSSAMWVGNRIVNRPADGVERPVGNHLGVVLRSDLVACDRGDEAEKIAAARARETSSTTTTTKTTTTRTTTTTTTSTAPPPSPPR